MQKEYQINALTCSNTNVTKHKTETLLGRRGRTKQRHVTLLFEQAT